MALLLLLLSFGEGVAVVVEVKQLDQTLDELEGHAV